MASPTTTRCSSTSSVPLPSPKPSPRFPDLYGKRREMARLQTLEREITFLEEELKSSEGLQPASRCCKEIADFVVANSDPLLPTSKKKRRSRRFWKWLCRIPCFNMSWICCCCCDGCSKLCCFQCNPCNCSCNCFPSFKCCLPKWNCCCGKKSNCCKESFGCKNCWPFPSCCSCKCSCSCSCPTCSKVFNSCYCCCTKSCFNPCFSCCC